MTDRVHERQDVEKKHGCQTFLMYRTVKFKTAILMYLYHTKQKKYTSNTSIVIMNIRKYQQNGDDNLKRLITGRFHTYIGLHILFAQNDTAYKNSAQASTEQDV